MCDFVLTVCAGAVAVLPVAFRPKNKRKQEPKNGRPEECESKTAWVKRRNTGRKEHRTLEVESRETQELKGKNIEHSKYKSRDTQELKEKNTEHSKYQSRETQELKHWSNRKLKNKTVTQKTTTQEQQTRQTEERRNTRAQEYKQTTATQDNSKVTAKVQEIRHQSTKQHKSSQTSATQEVRNGNTPGKRPEKQVKGERGACRQPARESIHSSWRRGNKK